MHTRAHTRVRTHTHTHIHKHTRTAEPFRLALCDGSVAPNLNGPFCWRQCASLLHSNKHARAIRFPEVLCVSRIKKLLGWTEMPTCDRMCFQTIQTVWDISRDDRASIVTCSLLTSTDRFKENYSIDYCATQIWTLLLKCHSAIETWTLPPHVSS